MRDMDPSGAKERVGGTVVSTVSDERTLLPDAPITSVDHYLESGGGISLGKALSLPRAEIIEVVAEAGLRGRGGAGFPAAAKWRGLMRDQDGVKYLCCNAAEGEPATFKDRLLMRTKPDARSPHPRSGWVAEGELERSVGPEGPLGAGPQRLTLECPAVDHGLHPTRRHDAHDRSHARRRGWWLLSLDRRRGSNVNG